MTHTCCTAKDAACAEKTLKKALVEYLYLDLQTCDRCIGTDHVLDKVLEALTPALNLAGYQVEYNKVEMETEALARKYRFLSSPTIRVNGSDICQTVTENSCGCCSDISGTDIDCRVFEYQGGTYDVPPEEMLAEAVLTGIFGQKKSACCSGEYMLPENLKTFYEGKKKQQCTCGCSCC